MLAYVELIKFKRLLKFTGIVLGVDVVEADSGSTTRGRSRREIENKNKPFPSRARREPVETSRRTKSKLTEGT